MIETSSTPEPVRVVVVDGHPVMRIGLSALLESMPGVTVVGQAGDGVEAVHVTVAERPDVVTLDLELGAGSGITALRDIVRAAPETNVLVVTAISDDDSLFGAIRAGARGYVLKGTAPEELARAVRAVGAGNVLLGRDVAHRAMAFVVGARRRNGGPFPELTARECEVLDLVAQGQDNATIARRLALSAKTVRNYVYAIFAKLEVTSRSALIVRAREAGLGLQP